MKKLLLRKTVFPFLLFLSGLFIVFPAQGQWMPLPQQQSNLNCAITFLNPDTGFIAGDSAFNGMLIQRTLDGGQTWTRKMIPNGLLAMGICFPNDTIGYCGGKGAAVYKTINMGQTWFYAGTVAPQTNLSSLYFTSADTGFAADFTGQIFKTTNGAQSWTSVSPALNSFQNFYPGTGKFQFLDDSTGFLANGNYGKVMKTRDGGDSWTSMNLPSQGTWALSIYMFNKDTGIVTAEAGKTWRTYNGGISWIPSIISAYDLLDVTFFNDSIGYIVGGENNNYIFHAPPYPALGGVIYVTSNAGVSWTLDTTSICCDWLTSICDAGNNVGYAAGWNGALYKINNALSLTAVAENYPAAAIKIYPNPAADELHIECSAEHFQIQLSDLSGRLLFKVNDQHTLETKNLATGIYPLSITGGNQTHSEKIMIQH